MKRAYKLIALALLVFIGQAATAQELKFGHIDTQELLGMMPEMKTAQTQLEAYATELQNDLEVLAVEFNNKRNEFEQKQAEMSDLLRETKQEELMTMQQNIQRYQQNSDQKFNQKQQELVGPVVEKARKAIQDVAKENGFTYVFDVSQGALVYFSEHSTDLLPLVQQKLGIVDQQ